MNCTLCHTSLTRKMDAFYFSCTTCSALIKDGIFYLSPEDEKAIYEIHNNDVEDPRYQKFVSPVTSHVTNHFQKNSLGLDYGCGAAPVVTKVLTDRGYNIKPYDPFFNPEDGYLELTYDYIVACEVFEHFHQPAEEIEKLVSMLKPNGELIIHTMLYHEGIAFKNWHYRRDDTHVIIYTQETMVYIAKKHDLDIVWMDKRLVIMKKRQD